MKFVLTDSVKHFKVSPLVKIEKRYFSEGELYVKLNENLKGGQVTVVSNILTENILEFLFIIDALKREGARIRVMIPFLSYARQDKLYNKGEAVAGSVVCSILKSLNVPISIYDIHNKKIGHCSSFKHESVLALLSDYLPKKDFLVVSPDKGGMQRARDIAQKLNKKFLVIDKVRKGNRIISSFSGKIDSRQVLIVDDMISSGETLIKTIKLLEEKGAKEIYCISAHGLFVNGARKRLEKTIIKKIIVSNTLSVKSSKKINVVKIDRLLKG